MQGSLGPAALSCGANPMTASTCACSDDFSKLNGMPCDGSCGNCSMLNSTCGAKCAKTCDSDVPRWHSWCTE
jgi:hypothetical protein